MLEGTKRKRKERKERKKREEGEEKKSENGVGGSIDMERNNSVDEQGIMVLFGLGVIEGAG